MKIKDEKQQDFLMDLEDRLNTLYESTEKQFGSFNTTFTDRCQRITDRMVQSD